MTDYYKCENCGKIFDEFEMNYKAAQIDKRELCRDCRNKTPVFKASQLDDRVNGLSHDRGGKYYPENAPMGYVR